MFCEILQESGFGFLKKVWGILYTGQKIVKNTVVGFDIPARSVEMAVPPLCRELDIPRPIVLSKHEKEMDQFGYTVFSSDDFIEHVDFERFSVRRLDEEDTKKK